MDDHPIANDLDQELFSELVEPLVQPLLVHMVAPFVNGDDKNFSLQINGKLLWEWRKLNGNLKKLFAILQANLRLIGYTLKESVSVSDKRFSYSTESGKNFFRKVSVISACDYYIDARSVVIKPVSLQKFVID